MIRLGAQIPSKYISRWLRRVCYMAQGLKYPACGGVFEVSEFRFTIGIYVVLQPLRKVH